MTAVSVVKRDGPMYQPTELPWQTVDWRQASAELTHGADTALRAEVEEMFAEQRVVGRACRRKVIACSLFFKPTNLTTAWESPDERTVHTVQVRGGTRTWWEAYAAPLLENLHQLPYLLPEYDVHLYLAADLEWLVESLALPQVVIHVMRHASVASQPGAMWRFLAHDLDGVEEVANLDAEDDWNRLLNSSCIEEWRHSDLALFRHINPVDTFPQDPDVLVYRPVCACLFLYRPQADFSMRAACEAFAATAVKRQIPTTLNHPTRGELPIFGTTWPHYGMDETFLQQVFYPFFMHRGVHTNYPACDYQVLFPLDLKAAFAAHPEAALTQGLGANHSLQAALQFGPPPRDARQVPNCCDYWGLYDWVVDNAPAGATLLEIGCLHGGSLAYLAQRAQASAKNLRVVGVDLGVGADHFNHAVPFTETPILLANLLACGVTDICTLIPAESTQAARLFADESLWFVFVDGSHDYHSVWSDLRAWWPKVARGGWIAGHDYQFHVWTEVAQAVDQFFHVPRHALVAPQAPTCFLKQKE